MPLINTGNELGDDWDRRSGLLAAARPPKSDGNNDPDNDHECAPEIGVDDHA